MKTVGRYVLEIEVVQNGQEELKRERERWTDRESETKKETDGESETKKETQIKIEMPTAVD